MSDQPNREDQERRIRDLLVAGKLLVAEDDQGRDWDLIPVEPVQVRGVVVVVTDRGGSVTRDTLSVREAARRALGAAPFERWESP